jgi:AcrR family transcriptional regulator
MNIHHPDPVSESTTLETSAVPGPRRRPGGRSARIQAVVFEATLRLLEEKGYEALSFASIAECAGVHEATLYRRWKAKEQLVLDAATHRVEDAIPVQLINLVAHPWEREQQEKGRMKQHDRNQ